MKTKLDVWIDHYSGGVRVPHPAPCECGCWCMKDCRCNGKTCVCEVCDIFHKHGIDYSNKQKEFLAICDCGHCTSVRPEAAKRFKH